MGFRKNVYVLGAGFYADAGAPLMNDFFSRARSLRDDPNSALTPEERKIFERVIQYRFELDKALAKVLVDPDNIEELFGFLEMELRLSPKANVTLRNDMIYLITRTLEATSNRPLSMNRNRVVVGPVTGNRWQYWFRGSQYGFFVGIASGLWNPAKQKEGSSVDSIISFNYDLILEREMSSLGVGPVYECTGAAYYEGFPAAEVRLRLLKMHGSANWFHHPDCGTLWVFPPDKAKTFDLPERLCPSCKKFGLSSIIVPPTWNKGIEARFILPVWKQALEDLTDAGRIFIIGYSFPDSDQFFKYLLGLALSENTALTELHVVSNTEKIRERFEALFHPYFHGRVVKYHTDGAVGFLDRIQDYTNQVFEQANVERHFVRP